MRFDLKNVLMAFGPIRRYLVSRELQRMEREALKHELKVEFATLNQDNYDIERSFCLKSVGRYFLAKELGIFKELPTAEACRVFLYGKDIVQAFDSYVPPPVQMPNSVSVHEGISGSCTIKVVGGEKFRSFSPNEPAFNSDNSKFLWNGAVYVVPKEYYGRPLDSSTLRQLALEIADTQARMLDELES